MNYLADTSIVSLLMRDEQWVRARIDNLGPTHFVFISVISEGELEYGLWKVGQETTGGRRDALTRTMALFVDVVDVDRAAALAYAGIKHNLITHGRAISVNDTWIAAIAVSNDMTLIHRDRGFGYVSGLRQENWTGP